MSQRWLNAWNIGEKPFDGEAFRPLFAPGPDAIRVFDNVKGDVVVLTSVDDYIATWTPFMKPLTHWSVEMRDLEIFVSGTVATTTFRLVGTDTRGPEGEPIAFGQYGTHIWHKLPEHGWRIVHEHLTAYALP